MGLVGVRSWKELGYVGVEEGGSRGGQRGWWGGLVGVGDRNGGIEPGHTSGA